MNDSQFEQIKKSIEIVNDSVKQMMNEFSDLDKKVESVIIYHGVSKEAIDRAFKEIEKLAGQIHEIEKLQDSNSWINDFGKKVIFAVLMVALGAALKTVFPV